MAARKKAKKPAKKSARKPLKKKAEGSAGTDAGDIKGIHCPIQIVIDDEANEMPGYPGDAACVAIVGGHGGTRSPRLDRG